MPQDIYYHIALSQIKGIGHKTAKNIVALCGGVQQVFDFSKKELIQKGVSENIAKALQERDSAFALAARELDFISKKNIEAIHFLDKRYPRRLTYCDDSPTVLFVEGKMDLNPAHAVAIVGTRNATDYGRQTTDKIIKALQPYDACIISGLAYGIDITAHQSALKHGLSTIGCLGSGLGKIYPALHANTATKMMDHGGLVSQFFHDKKPDRENFPQRNAIIAGMVDAVIIVESDVSGGSIITTDLARMYRREVFAVPGRVDDPYSGGPNGLIAAQKAKSLHNPKNLPEMLGWKIAQKERPKAQLDLFQKLSPSEQALLDILHHKGKTPIDVLALESKLTVSQASVSLLTLEFSGFVRTLPGKVYALA